MRIELLDPRYAQTKRKLDERRQPTGLAEADDIATNLSQLAKKRTDIFGTLAYNYSYI